MKEQDAIRILSRLLSDDLSNKKRYIRLAALLFGIVIDIIAIVIIVKFYGWMLFLAIFLLLLGHNIEKHWPGHNPIEEEMRKQFLKEVNGGEDVDEG